MRAQTEKLTNNLITSVKDRQQETQKKHQVVVEQLTNGKSVGSTIERDLTKNIDE